MLRLDARSGDEIADGHLAAAEAFFDPDRCSPGRGRHRAAAPRPRSIRSCQEIDNRAGRWRAQLPVRSSPGRRRLRPGFAEHPARTRPRAAGVQRGPRRDLRARRTRELRRGLELGSGGPVAALQPRSTNRASRTSTLWVGGLAEEPAAGLRWWASCLRASSSSSSRRCATEIASGTSACSREPSCHEVEGHATVRRIIRRNTNRSAASCRTTCSTSRYDGSVVAADACRLLASCGHVTGGGSRAAFLPARSSVC